MEDNKERSVESVVIGAGIKYSGKVALSYWPYIQVIFALFLVRLQLKKTVSFKMKYMKVASTWADRLGLGETCKYGYSFPGGIKMHRAIGISEYDNSEALTIMNFEKREDKK